MHSGGSSSSVVSVAPATPIIKNMIGIAALVLEGRDRDTTVNVGVADLGRPKDPTVIPPPALRATGTTSADTSSPLAFPALDATAVAAAMACTANNSQTASMTTLNWARAQNNQLAHIYRLKNRVLVETAATGGSNRSSPVSLYDYDSMGSVAGAGLGFPPLEDDGAIFDPMQHLTSGRICRLTTPRSFLQTVEKRQTSTSSSSSTGSSSATFSAATPAGRRNSRSSPGGTTTVRTHCDDFLRTIGLLKGVNSQRTNSPVGSLTTPARSTMIKSLLKSVPGTPTDESEAHYCDEVVNSEVSENNKCVCQQSHYDYINCVICFSVSVGNNSCEKSKPSCAAVRRCALRCLWDLRPIPCYSSSG